MDEILQLLSNLASDRVRHFELVKITNKGITGKVYALVGDDGLHLVTCNLSGLLKGGSFKYDSIKSVEKGTRRVSVMFLQEEKRLVGSLHMETPCNTKLYNKIKIAQGAYYMRCNSREYEQFPEDEGSSRGQERTLLPFKGYKKVVLDDYFFFVRETVEHTSFTSGSFIRLQDKTRGISMTVNLQQPMPIHFPEKVPPQDLYQYGRGFLQEFTVVEILKDEHYNKRMNLNNDLAKWQCYHILIKAESSLVAYFVFRRLYIPPMLDSYQDIFIRFDVVTNGEAIPNLSAYYNEICIAANSITAVDQYTLWYKDIIQVRLDNLRFEHDMYKFLKSQYNLTPSYYNLIKEFVFSVVRLLPQQLVDQKLLGRLKGSLGPTSDKPMDYIYMINSVMFGVGGDHESKDRQELMNKFNMRLADFIALCFDELLLGSQLSLGILTRYLNHLEDNTNKEALREVTAYLLHFRHKDYSKPYSPSLLYGIIDTYRNESSHFSWNNVIFNQYAASRLIEEGFFIHQYAAELRNFEGRWNPYINLLTDLIEQYRNEMIVERMFKRFLEIPMPVDDSYLPLMKCLIGVLRRQTSNHKITVMITSILTNFSFHANHFKEYMAKQNLATILVDNILSKEDEIVLTTLKLMINLTKTTEQQDEFINQGVISNFIILLERYYGKHSTIIGYGAGVLGQLFNSTNLKVTQDQLDYILEVMLFSFHVGTADPNMMVMLMFCLRKLPKTRNMYIKIGNHVIRSVIMNLQVYRDDDFVINSLELLIDLTMRVQNCITMRKFSLLESLDKVPMNDTLIQIANKLRELVIRRTRFLTL